MAITQEYLTDITPSLQSAFLACGMILNEIRVDPLPDDEYLAALHSEHLTFTIEATVIQYRPKEGPGV